MKNLKVGDVVKDDDDTEYEIYEMFTRTAVVKCRTYLSLIDLNKLKNYTLVQPKEQWSCGVDKLLTQRDNQAYTSLVEGIKAQVKDINGEGSVFDDFATDILKNVVKPLYGKE